jgi:hypothetical protein
MKRKMSHLMRGLFRTEPRYRQVLPAPLQGASPWYWTAGPVFTPQGAGALLNSKKSKPWQSIFGYAYRVANPQKFTPLQPHQLYAPKGVPTVGINIQTGWQPPLTPSVNSDGSWATNGTLNSNGTLTPQGAFASGGSMIDYGEASSMNEYGDFS